MIRFIFIVVLTLLTPIGALAQVNTEPTMDDLAKAIASMRRIDPYSLSKEQQKTKARELDEAWQVLLSAGARGAAALKEEINKIDSQKEKDDHFKLGAAALLWQIGKAEEAQTIAAIWSGNVDLNANNKYVFFTAFDAARTQNSRVLPMLTGHP